MPVVFKGDGGVENRSYTLWVRFDGVFNVSATQDSGRLFGFDSSKGLIELHRWSHIATVIDATRGELKLFVNGIEVARGEFGQAILPSQLPLRIGGSHERDSAARSFAGEIDAVRIWRVARSAEDIAATMYSPLTSQPEGLVGYWNFEADGEKVIDATGHGYDGQFIGDASRVQSNLPTTVPKPAIISGVVKNEAGAGISSVSVRLVQGDSTMTETHSDARGHYFIATWSEGTYDLYGTKETLGDIREGLSLHSGTPIQVNLDLQEAIRISGTLLMLDDKTPHAGIFVQAIHNGEVVATTQSQENGSYQFINLLPNTYRIRCLTHSGYLYYGDDTQTRQL